MVHYGGGLIKMSLSAKLKREVRNAINKLGDLAITVVLNKKNVTDYNFTTNAVTATTLITTTTKGVLLDAHRAKGTENPSVGKRLLLSVEDIEDPDIYDTVTIGSVIWNIVPPYQSNGYTITLNIVKEA